MLFNKVSGGAEKVKIDGKPATEKLDLVKQTHRYHLLQNTFPKINFEETWTWTLNLSNRENIFFSNKEYGYTDVYKGSIKKGWTLLGYLDHMGGSDWNHYYHADKNNCIYYIGSDVNSLRKRNLIDFTETIISPYMSTSSETTMCIPFKNSVFVMSGTKYMYKIKNNLLTDITAKVLNSGFPFYQLPVGVFEKDGYLYLVKDAHIFKTKDLENWEVATAKNGNYDFSDSVLFTLKGETYLMAENWISDDVTNIKVYKFENDNYKDVGIIKADSGNSFKYGLTFLYIEDEEKLYVRTKNKQIILLNDVVYKEREV